MRKIYFPLFAFALLLAGLKSQAQTTINVVFHVVYKTTAQNVPDSCLQQQLDVLNEDFNAANPDLWKVPSAWVPIIGNMNVNFVLASIDPSGNPTTGIERHQTVTTSWTTNNNVMHASMDGLDAWPDTSYLNIWVCNLQGGLMSYSQFPGGPAATDGVVIHYQATGRGSYCLSPFNLGRAGTHAVGHWFGLKNFAPSQSCANNDDQINDTPTYTSQSIYGGFNPFQVVTDACNPSAPGIMWMNFMTYVDDSSMYFFTQEQTDTMNWYLSNMRIGLGNPLGVSAPANPKSLLSIFPSPSASGYFTIHRPEAENAAAVTVYNSLGELVASLPPIEAGEKTAALDLSFLPAGIYTAVLTSENSKESQRISIVR